MREKSNYIDTDTDNDHNHDIMYRYGDIIEDVPWRGGGSVTEKNDSSEVNEAGNSDNKTIEVASSAKKKGKSRKSDSDSDTDDNERTLYTFPTLKQLSVATEEELRANGFGYRAKFIVETTKLLVKLDEETKLKQKLVNRIFDGIDNDTDNGGGNDTTKNNIHNESSRSEDCDWLLGLRECTDRTHVLNSLEQLPGIGPKVARCIALFSLDTDDSIPVDTHVWQITQKYYSQLLIDEIRAASLQTRARADLENMNGDKKKGSSKKKEELREDVLLASMPKTLTPRVMEMIENVFNKLYGKYSVRTYPILEYIVLRFYIYIYIYILVVVLLTHVF